MKLLQFDHTVVMVLMSNNEEKVLPSHRCQESNLSRQDEGADSELWKEAGEVPSPQDQLGSRGTRLCLHHRGLIRMVKKAVSISTTSDVYHSGGPSRCQKLACLLYCFLQGASMPGVETAPRGTAWPCRGWCSQQNTPPDVNCAGRDLQQQTLCCSKGGVTAAGG